MSHMPLQQRSRKTPERLSVDHNRSPIAASERGVAVMSPASGLASSPVHRRRPRARSPALSAPQLDLDAAAAAEDAPVSTALRSRSPTRSGDEMGATSTSDESLKRVGRKFGAATYQNAQATPS